MGLAIAALLLLGSPPAGGVSDLAGAWRAVIASPGGELPFTLRIAGGTPPAVAINGSEEVPFSSGTRDGSRILLRIDVFDSAIVAHLAKDGTRLDGEWSRATAGGRSRMAFSALKGDSRRFVPEAGPPAPPAAPRSVAGAWAVVLEDSDGSEPQRAEFRQEGERVVGTFLTPTGDMRFLEGDYRNGLLRLSAFDGSHVVLYRARALADGTLTGDHWSREVYHATWKARRLEPGAADGLPDPWAIATIASPEGRLRFRFPDLEGHPVASEDARFAGRVVLVNLFGSWCPNSNDEAPLLADLLRRHRERGLEVVGLAYELTADAVRSRRALAAFAERNGVSYPLLLAGTSDKPAASRTLPDLTKVAAFPTTVFVGRDGRVRKVYAGYAGPGTFEHHARLREQFERLVEELLSE